MYIKYILTILFFRSINCFNLPDLPHLNNPVITISELFTTYNIGKITKKSISKIDINPNINHKVVHIICGPNLWYSLFPLSIYFNTEIFLNLLSRNIDKAGILEGPLLYTIILSLITLTN